MIRLYTAEDFHRRRDHDEPEILRRELSGLCLQLEAASIHHPSVLEWLDAPAPEAVEAAERLLDRLGARGEEGRAMARLPVHPRLARLLLAGDSDRACRIAALLSSGQRVDTLDDEPDERTKRVYRQLRRQTQPGKSDDRATNLAVLKAFPDRVGRRGSSGTVLLSSGGSVEMKKIPAEFMVVIDPPWLAHPIEPEWLVDLFPERVRDVSTLEWNRHSERAEAVSALLYDELVITETHVGSVDEEAAAQLLASKAIDAGLARFIDQAEVEEFLARVEFAAAHSSLPSLAAADIEQELCRLCDGLRSFSELEKRASALIPSLASRVGTAGLERVAPARLQLAAGRNVKVRYERGKTPWIASRLQDFFGMKETPRIAGGAVALLVHLLAPNQRPVQTTTDLAGFWERLYPQLRRELSRRYPKHSWPEKPV